jgi:hypothetical protein
MADRFYPRFVRGGISGPFRRSWFRVAFCFIVKWALVLFAVGSGAYFIAWAYLQ